MSTRNLDKLFKPRSVALIGASARPGSVGRVLAHNLATGGFAGKLMLVDPHGDSLEGLPVHADVASLPETPDLAVIATPPDTVPGLLAELGARGTRGAVVITAGFGELGARGRQLQLQAVTACRPYLLRLVGPNCVGIMVPGQGLDASFSHIAPMKGDLAFISQSGAMVTAVLDWAAARRIGFSHVVSLGDMADVDFGDMIDYVASDPATRAILLYAEGVSAARKFMSAARAAARFKPVLAVKVGRFAEGAKAARSHTGALAGADAVYEAAFRRAGMLRLDNMTELFDAVETLALTRPQQGDRLAILTNGGGPGVLATDALIARGGRLATIGAATLAKLDAVLPATWSHGNPIDIIGDAPAERYVDALKLLLADTSEVDAILVLNCPTALARPADAARAVIQTLTAAPPGQLSGRNVLTTWLGEHTAIQARRYFAGARIASYDTPDNAVRGFMNRVQYRRNQELLLETPEARLTDFAPDLPRAAAAIARGLAALSPGERGWLAPEDVAEVLAAYGIPAPPLRIARTPADAEAAGSAIGFPVALKIRSPQIAHKSDVGGVALNLGTPERLGKEAAAMLERVPRARPDAVLEGFLVQQMVQRPGAIELIVGLVDDEVFGPVVMFGQGGITVELMNDTTLELPPLNAALARAQIARTRVAKLLEGYRGQPPAAMDAVIDVLLRVAQMASDQPAIRELDINPLLADAAGVIAVDARIGVAVTHAAPGQRLAICPYPRELERSASLRDGSHIWLRPIRPEDEPLLHDVVSHMSPEDLRFRFFAPLKEMSHQLAARLSQIDYDREMAIIALAPEDGTALGAARFSADPDNLNAEFAIALRSDFKHQGIGRLLMGRLIEIARKRGIGALQGDVLRDNERMLAFCRELGFTISSHPDAAELVRATLKL